MQQPTNESSAEEAQKVREKQCNKKAAGESGFKSICITMVGAQKRTRTSTMLLAST